MLNSKGLNYKEEIDLTFLKNKHILTVPQLSVDGTLMNMKQAVQWLQEEC